jgi:epsin
MESRGNKFLRWQYKFLRLACGKNIALSFQTLTLIDFLIKNGSERFIEASRDKLYKIRTLQDFNFYEGTVDKGSGVREKAKSLVEMLGNNEIIRSERDKARQLRNKFVGIDSRNAGGGGGGGSYGGNSYDNNGGGSSNYGGSGGNGNNGNNYGGNSNNNSYGGNSNGGRYGGESSYDNNGRYGDQGIDSQSSNNRRGSDTTNHGNTPSRYGGGAYDSDHPPRYGDDAPAAEEEDNKPFRSSKPKTPTSAPTVSGGGKLKVSIKKAAPADAAPRQTVAAAPEIDLFGDGGEVDFMSAGAATAAPHGGNDLFDAFSSAPAAPQQQQASFDPFGSAPSVAPSNNYNAQVFDPFGAAPPVYAAPPVAAAFDPFAVAPQTFPPNNNNFQPAYQQQQQQQQPLNVFQNNGFQQAQQQQQQQQPVFAPQTPHAVPAPVIALNRAPSNTFQQQPHEADFGDFEAAPQQQQQQKSAPAPSKWGDLGKLVDLSGIGKNEVQAKPNAAGASGGANNNYQQSAFAGLDGFSKTVHNMVC